MVQNQTPQSALDQKRGRVFSKFANEITGHDELNAVATALRLSGGMADARQLIYLSATSGPLADVGVATQVLRLCDALEDNEDVQPAHANFDLSEELLTSQSA